MEYDASPSQPPKPHGAATADGMGPPVTVTPGISVFVRAESARSVQPERKKRGRIATACSQCHSRKQKCNGGRPCQNCLHRGVAGSCAPSSPRVSKKLHLGLRENSVPTGNAPSLVHDSPPVPPKTAESSSSSHVGQLWNSRGAPTFYGTSYFGPQVAATMIEAAAPEIAFGVHSARSSAAQSFRDESGPWSQLWDLLGLLPRQKSTVDRLTDKFLTELNWTIDAVHPATFRDNYNKFWDRKSGFDDITTIDLRWLALLFIILAFGELLDCPQPCSPESQREYEDSSLRFYWASRRAIVIAPSFYGESSDLVRAGVLVTRYLIYSRRLTESWLTVGFASRMAMAQGIHVDGDRFHLPRKATETRRRLWSHLYTLDRTIALAVGRPYAISEQHSLSREVVNVWVDDLTNEGAELAEPQPLSNPTPSILSLLNHRLAHIIGRIQEQCFGLDPPIYDIVLSLDRELLNWKNQLPAYFKLENPDLSMDNEAHAYLKWHRFYLHTNYHFARITLHRPYLLRTSITNRFQHSRDACIDSACTDLRVRLSINNVDLVEKLKWSLGAHQLFNSALVLGIIAVRSPNSTESRAILEDLEAYCEKQKADLWMNEFGLAEIRVVQLCIDQAKQRRSQAAGMHPHPPSEVAQVPMPQPLPDSQSEWQYNAHTGQQYNPQGDRLSGSQPPRSSLTRTPNHSNEQFQSLFEPSASVLWPDPFYSFPEAGDLQVWQEMINTIASDY